MGEGVVDFRDVVVVEDRADREGSDLGLAVRVAGGPVVAHVAEGPVVAHVAGVEEDEPKPRER